MGTNGMTNTQMVESIYQDLVDKKGELRPARIVNNQPLKKGLLTDNACLIVPHNSSISYVKDTNISVLKTSNGASQEGTNTATFLFDFTNRKQIYIKARGSDSVGCTFYLSPLTRLSSNLTADYLNAVHSQTLNTTYYEGIIDISEWDGLYTVIFEAFNRSNYISDCYIID